MKVDRIDHIHIKTNDIERDKRLIETLLGNKLLFEADLTDAHGVRVAFYGFPLGVQLMEATDKDKEQGGIYDALPQGVCAFSLPVPDLDEAVAEMKLMGYEMLYLYDFGQVREAMFDTRKDFGVFVELVQLPEGSMDKLLEDTLPKLQE